MSFRCHTLILLLCLFVSDTLLLCINIYRADQRHTSTRHIVSIYSDANIQPYVYLGYFHTAGNDDQNAERETLPKACQKNTAELIQLPFGSITSPRDLSKHYYNNMDCQWVIYGNGYNVSIPIQCSANL